MNKENETISTPKSDIERFKESYGTVLMSAGVVFIVLILLWIPFKLIPSIFSGGTNFVSTTLSSMFIPDESTSTKPAATNNTKVTSKSEAVNSNVSMPKTYYGKSDLEVSLVSTGIIDPASKKFVQTNYAGFNDEIAIKFQVKNSGTNISGAWKLRINTPSRTTPYFDSEDQVSIKPGDRIIFTTTFNSPLATGINDVYITADPLNMVDEVSESNNQLTVPIKIEGTTYNYNNNYNYGSGAITSNLPYGTLYTWNNMTVDCYASPGTTSVGRPVNWYSTVSGGNGYYSYSWTGTDQLYGNLNTASKIYNSVGPKIATVTITSGGQSVTKQCRADIVSY